jgi:hypothetical protein
MGTSIMDCGQEASALLARLSTPSRNRYFYGKLLDAYHLELEQRYGNGKRWLVNRLSLGTGVLCGLDVVASADGGRVRVSAGVAIDGLGREIIVPQDSAGIDPAQPTDECGRPEGPPVRGDETVTLLICYHECEAEPVRAMVSECGDEQECENGLVRERYRLRIVRGEPASPVIVTPEQCTTIFSQPPNGMSRREVVCQTLDVRCDPPDETCVPLAVIGLNGRGGVATIRRCAFRRTLYSNAVLFDLIMCLAARVDECCGGLAVRSLMIVSGNNQGGTVGEPLAQPLVVRVVDGGAPVANEPVTFEPLPGDGDVGADAGSLGPSFTVNSDGGGLATCPVWRLGPTPGAQRATARIAAGTPSLVTFVAKAGRAQVDLPVVRAIWPTNAVTLDAASADPIVRAWLENFRASPRLEVTFNHQMLADHLQKPDGWLRAFLLRRQDERVVEARRMPLQYSGAAPSPILGQAGFTEVFAFGGAAPGTTTLFAAGAVPSLTHAAAARLEARLLVLMRAEGGSIVDTGTPARLLDAEFAGTRLTAVEREALWQVGAPQQFPPNVWAALVDTGERLPQSGDDAEGGQFHGWFALVL